MPSPIAAQQRTVTTDNVTFKLVMECAGLGFRSQHRVSKYNNNPNNEMMSNAAGAEPNIPKLCNDKNMKNSFKELINKCVFEKKKKITLIK